MSSENEDVGDKFLKTHKYTYDVDGKVRTILCSEDDPQTLAKMKASGRTSIPIPDTTIQLDKDKGQTQTETQTQDEGTEAEKVKAHMREKLVEVAKSKGIKVREDQIAKLKTMEQITDYADLIKGIDERQKPSSRAVPSGEVQRTGEERVSFESIPQMIEALRRSEASKNPREAREAKQILDMMVDKFSV